MKLLIAIPSARDWEYKFGHHLSELLFYLGKKGIDAKVYSLKYPLLSENRQRALQEAIKQKASHLLFLDDDMTFPPKAFEFMLSRNLDVVVANYAKKDSRLIPVAKDMNGKALFSMGKTGVEEISGCGLGFALLKTASFSNIDPPHFEILWNEKFKVYQSEDVYFFQKLRDHGVKIYVDHDASMLITHAGSCYHTLKGTIAFVGNNEVAK